MSTIGRNDPCPCGSGKKFKKCHEGREEELVLSKMEYLPEGAAEKIAALPEVEYGRCREILAGLDIIKLTNKEVGVRLVDLKTYLALGYTRREPPQNVDQMSAGQMINPFKTMPVDPYNIYLAVSPAISDSTFIHQLAHVLDYLAGSKRNPSLAKPLAMELEVPLELLEHPKEFGDWLLFLKNEFAVELDAEDTVVAFLHEHGRLIPGEVLDSGQNDPLTTLIKNTITFLRDNRQALDARIRGRAGYLPRAAPVASPSA